MDGLYAILSPWKAKYVALAEIFLWAVLGSAFAATDTALMYGTNHGQASNVGDATQQRLPGCRKRVRDQPCKIHAQPVVYEYF